jgi:hypothetical protein
VDGRGWPGSCHEHKLVELAGLDQVLAGAGYAGTPWLPSRQTYGVEILLVDADGGVQLLAGTAGKL